MSPLELLEARRWLGPLVVRSLLGRRGPKRGEPVHLILAIADHFEPNAEDASVDLARERVAHWVREYPATVGRFRDADGRPPRHTFFYPVEVYDPEHLDALAGLCRQGFGEVEVHLHHDGDTAENLRATLTEAVRLLSERHGLLARDRETGAAAYGFVHGNWALNNARPDGRWCGVNDEIRILRETGCYADFTFPSAPSPTQPPTLNRIYHAKGDPCRSRGHDHAVKGPNTEGSLMLVEGPLLLNWGDRRRGIVPTLENACVQTSQPATLRRLDLWLKARVQVAVRPDWYFVKLHSHGGPERDRDVLCGSAMAEFHEALARKAADNPNFHVHYVTAREMYNIARAAEDGWSGTVDSARDYRLLFNGGHAVAGAFQGRGESFHD